MDGRVPTVNVCYCANFLAVGRENSQSEYITVLYFGMIVITIWQFLIFKMAAIHYLSLLNLQSFSSKYDSDA